MQQISLQCSVVNEVQNISTHTAVIPDVQLVFINTSFLSTDSVVQEVQQVMCDAIGGVFALSFNGYTTASIPFNADVTTIANALQQLAIINSVVVTFVNGAVQACIPQASSPGAAFSVNFTSVVGLSGDLPLLMGSTNGLIGLRRIVVTEIVRGMAGIGGTFRLSFQGSMTSDISAFASASTLYTALTTVSTIPVGAITVTDLTSDLVNKQGRLFSVAFIGASVGGDVEALQVVTQYNALTGSDVSITVYSDGAALAPTDSTSAPPSVSGNQIGGSFFLTLQGYTVGPIDFNVADTVLATQLETLPNVGVVSVLRIGPSVYKEYQWIVTFLSTPGYFPPGTVSLIISYRSFELA